jgi:hypothetical protein
VLLSRGSPMPSPDDTNPWPELPLAAWQSTYAAAADLGKWDRAALECPLGEPGKVRAVA